MKSVLYKDIYACVCACLEWAHRPSQKKDFSVSCNTKITGEEERNHVSFLVVCVNCLSVVFVMCSFVKTHVDMIITKTVTAQDECQNVSYCSLRKCLTVTQCS